HRAHQDTQRHASTRDARWSHPRLRKYTGEYPRLSRGRPEFESLTVRQCLTLDNSMHRQETPGGDTLVFNNIRESIPACHVGDRDSIPWRGCVADTFVCL